MALGKEHPNKGNNMRLSHNARYVNKAKGKEKGQITLYNIYREICMRRVFARVWGEMGKRKKGEIDKRRNKMR